MQNMHGECIQPAWRRGVSVLEEDSPPRKKYIVGTDEGYGWKNLLYDAYEKHDDTFKEKVEGYMNDGYSEEDARGKATDELYGRYVKTLKEKYKHTIITVNDVKESALHQKIMQDVDDLMKEKCYEFKKALNIAIRKNKEGFEDVVQEDDSQNESNTEDDSQNESTAEDEVEEDDSQNDSVESEESSEETE